MKARNLAIIPARGGSKRLPGKNTRLFCGKPIITYSIRAALDSDLFSEVMVSTDDDTIAEVAKTCGAAVPFLRGAAASNDTAGLAEAVEEVLLEYSRRAMDFGNFCVILATAPFVTTVRLRQAFDLMESTRADAALPVVAFGYPVQRALKLDDGKVSMIWPENYAKRSQDLPAAYHDSGQFYWGRTQTFLKQKTLFAANCAALVLPELEAEDIDTEEHFKLAEIKFGLLQQRNL